MRRRSGEVAGDDGFMLLLLLKSEADCLAAQQWQEQLHRTSTGAARVPTAKCSGSIAAARALERDLPVVVDPRRKVLLSEAIGKRA
jgi:hypothetical protein